MEKYLDYCLKSITNQENKDFEVILVNDGSNDQSLNICNNYVDKDERFILINKKNGGVSSARNAGLKIAKGKFIIFVDADDLISQDYLTIDSMFYNCDIIEKSSVHINSNNSKIIKCNSKKKSVIINDKKNLLTHFISNKNNALWDKFISKKAIGDSLFDEDLRVGEDLIFCASIANKIKSYGISTKGRYYYRIHNSSIMKTTISKSLEYINNLFHLISLIYSKAESPLIANGLIARYNIPKLVHKRNELNEYQKNELIKLLNQIKYKDLYYLNLKQKTKFLIKKYHYKLLFLHSK